MQLVSTVSEAILALHHANIDKVIEHGVMRERARNQSQLAAMKGEVEKAKNELSEEKSCISTLLEE